MSIGYYGDEEYMRGFETDYPRHPDEDGNWWYLDELRELEETLERSKWEDDGYISFEDERSEWDGTIPF